jgi:hypothetical protein
VTRAREAAVAIEAARVAAELEAKTFAEEATTARESVVALVRDVEDRATLARWEARERVLRVEVKSVAVLASAHEKAEGLVRRIALLEGDHAEVHQAREMAEENSRVLSNAAADAERRWEESKREFQQQFEELTLLQVWGSKLCLAIVSPPRVRNHLSEGMQI